VNKLALVGAVLALALIPVLVADAVYFYSGTFTFSAIAQPVVFGYGPNGNPSGSYATYVSVSNGTAGTGFSAQIYLTNSTYAYYYQIVQIKVNSEGYLYISNISLNSNYIESAYLYIQSSSGGSPTEIKIISNGNVVNGQTLPNAISLTPGKYYVSLLIKPTNPLPTPSTSLGNISLYFGYNPMMANELPLPPI